MSDFDSNFTKAIIDKLEKRLARKLTIPENKAFRTKRSGIAYEMMMDYVSDTNLSQIELENYINGVLAEIKM
ncbi:MAG: hypothetical protein ACI8ZM_005206 [Crocinitomix sp.]|jgi:hypothetical protein